MSEPTDPELLDRVRAGESAAFGQLFERHARAVYNFCFRATGDWSLAEDATSVVFMDAWRRRRDVVLADGGTLLPWLLGVARNVLRNRGRSFRRHRAALDRLPVPPAEPDFADDVAGRLDDERAIRTVLAVVGHLPRADRDVLELCVWSGLSYEQAAVALGVPVGTVRSRLSRARAKLRGLGMEPDRVSGQARGERQTALRPREDS
jgi:RNA polymerase sigma-70 factor (ECF subfamily)